MSLKSLNQARLNFLHVKSGEFNRPSSPEGKCNDVEPNMSEFNLPTTAVTFPTIASDTTSTTSIVGA
jgi:hypothetical protein